MRHRHLPGSDVSRLSTSFRATSRNSPAHWCDIPFARAARAEKRGCARSPCPAAARALLIEFAFRRAIHRQVRCEQSFLSNRTPALVRSRTCRRCKSSPAARRSAHRFHSCSFTIQPQRANYPGGLFAVLSLSLDFAFRFRGATPPNGNPTVRPIAAPPLPAGARRGFAFAAPAARAFFRSRPVLRAILSSCERAKNTTRAIRHLRPDSPFVAQSNHVHYSFEIGRAHV